MSVELAFKLNVSESVVERLQNTMTAKMLSRAGEAAPADPALVIQNMLVIMLKLDALFEAADHLTADMIQQGLLHPVTAAKPEAPAEAGPRDCETAREQS